MSALAASQSSESLASFQSGAKKRKMAPEEQQTQFLIDNIYANKRQKVNTADANATFKRGRYGFNDLGVLRTKPGNKKKKENRFIL